MQLTVLGCQGAYPNKENGTTSYLLQSGSYNLLIDAGSNTFSYLRQIIDPFDIDSVIITHYHHDHIADLGVLQYYLQLNEINSSKRILPIYGHTEDQCHFSDLSLMNVSEGLEYTEDSILDLGPFKISFLRTIHPVPTFALRISEKTTNKVLVFTADTGYLEELIPFAKDADVFLTDTYFLSDHRKHHAHLSTIETGEIARKANVKSIILSHLNENIDTNILLQETIESYGYDNVRVAKKGLVVNI